MIIDLYIIIFFFDDDDSFVEQIEIESTVDDDTRLRIRKLIIMKFFKLRTLEFDHLNKSVKKILGCQMANDFISGSFDDSNLNIFTVENQAAA